MRPLAVFLFALALAACDDAPPPAVLAPEVAAEQDSVLALLRAVDNDAFEAAYARLADRADRAYRVTTSTSQLGSDGEPVASHTQTFRVTSDGPERIAADSSGTFDFGGFERVADQRRPTPAFGQSPAALVLPDEPAYLDPRGREVFVFTFAGDTLLSDQPVRILTVTARPGQYDQPLRAARLYLDASGTLVGARVHRRQESVLFRESSRLALFLQPSADGWLPGESTTETTIQAPLAEARRFRLDERYVFAE